ncbi:Imm21 family immunity protein [Nocardiopsis sp. RSe5-2]|uniref:Imm21 family immunity protein n=1 Tax=Nocardiopsis endophytica TaxID=3018445 RepID=A0ABT4U0P1_9ACTN|nr:Imm21 family immunity protein [Nocardiopsis endophytica]MDA2810510.1 Imm21 family immunity protein [Nocardiopsis endophytica]
MSVPLEWVESMGGPLVVVPVSALPAWSGGTMSGILMGGDVLDDYDRAMAVDDLAGIVSVGGGAGRALVLGDGPDPGCYLPEHRAFLRWCGAESESRLRSAAEEVLADPATSWDECGTWVTDGPAVLMDAAVPGTELDTAYPDEGMPEQAPVPLPPGRWRVRATQTEADPETWVGLVQLLPADSADA